MNRSLSHVTVCACAVAAAAFIACGDAVAAQEGVTAEGRVFVTGGVSDSEQLALRSQRERFSLWVVTAAKGTGAYLSDVRIKVTDSQQRVLFDAALDGPWLMIDLPLGRYTVEADLAGRKQQHVTTIHPGDHHQAFFYFDVDADVSPPEAASPAKPVERSW